MRVGVVTPRLHREHFLHNASVFIYEISYSHQRLPLRGRKTVIMSLTLEDVISRTSVIIRLFNVCFPRFPISHDLSREYVL